jgi:hypothetical protein
MRYWSTEHGLEHPWPQAAAGYWWRYPNPHSLHVFSVDTLEVRQEGDLLYSRRLVLKTNSLPVWGKHFFRDARVAVVEECLVDRAAPRLTWYTRNIGLTPFMATVERATITPAGLGAATIRKECWIDSSIFGFRSAIKKFGVDRYKKNCGPATAGFAQVLARHADGTCPRNLSGLEQPAGPVARAVLAAMAGGSSGPGLGEGC